MNPSLERQLHSYMQFLDERAREMANDDVGDELIRLEDDDRDLGGSGDVALAEVGRRFPWPAAAAVAVVLMGAAALWWTRGSDETPPVAGRVDIEAWEQQQFDGLVWARVPDEASNTVGTGGSPTTTSPPVPGLVDSPHMDAVAAAGPGLVAVGTDFHVSFGTKPRIWTSPDGLRWRRLELDPQVFGGSVEDQVQLADVAAGGPGVVVVGDPGDSGLAPVWTSEDGVDWTNGSGDFDPALSPRLDSVVVGGPGLVAVGWVIEDGEPDAAVWTSTDGLQWSRVAHHSALGGPGRQAMKSVIAAGPGLVAVGEEHRSDGVVAAVWTSTDGLSWTRVADGEAFGGPHQTAAWSVIVGGPGLLAAGFEWDDNSAFPIGGVLWTSIDGLTWSRLPAEALEPFAAAHVVEIVSFESNLVAVGGVTSTAQGHIWTSADGLTWCLVPHDEAIWGLTGPAAGAVLDSTLVVVGAGFRRDWGSAVWAARSADEGFEPCSD